MKYGERVRRIREAKGIKAVFVARKLGLTPAGYSGIERGRAKLTAERAAKIAEILDVPIAEIFFDEEVSEVHKPRHQSA